MSYDIRPIVEKERICYHFLPNTPKMTFKLEGYKSYNKQLKPYSYYNFEKNNFLSVCSDKEYLLSCLFYGNTIIETLYTKKSYIDNLKKDEFKYFTSNPWAEIQIQRFYTGQKKEITIEMFNDLLLFANKYTLNIFFNFQYFNTIQVKTINDFFTRYAELNNNCKKVSEYYFEVEKIWNAYKNDINLFKDKLRENNIPKSSFFDKKKSIQAAYNHFKWNRTECNQILKTIS